MASGQIIVVGCGRLGALLANQLSGMGHQLVVIDQHEKAFDELLPNFSGFRIVGDAVEHDVLRNAGIEQASYFFAVTLEDNINLMVAQVARTIFQVPHVVARVYDPAREEIYRRLQIQTISPTRLSADMFLKGVL